MGVDIYWQIEYKLEDAWHWFPAKSNYERFIYSWQNKVVFDLLAGVYQNELAPCIVAPKGLPDDLSVALKAAHEERSVLGGHNFSWLTLRELNLPHAFWDTHSSRERPYRQDAADLLNTVLPCMRDLCTDIPFLPPKPPVFSGDLLEDTDLRAVFGFY